MPISAGIRDSCQVISTSGNNPICVSGIASRDDGVTTTSEARAAMPNPAPMVMPSSTARQGLG